MKKQGANGDDDDDDDDDEEVGLFNRSAHSAGPGTGLGGSFLDLGGSFWEPWGSLSGSWGSQKKLYTTRAVRKNTIQLERYVKTLYNLSCM